MTCHHSLSKASRPSGESSGSRGARGRRKRRDSTTAASFSVKGAQRSRLGDLIVSEVQRVHRGDHATGGLVTAGRRSSSATTSTVNNNNINGTSTRSLDVDNDASTGFMTQATRTPAEESARKARAKRRAFLLHAVGHGPPYDTQLPLVRQLSRLPLLPPALVSHSRYAGLAWWPQGFAIKTMQAHIGEVGVALIGEDKRPVMQLLLRELGVRAQVGWRCAARAGCVAAEAPTSTDGWRLRVGRMWCRASRSWMHALAPLSSLTTWHLIE